MTSPPDSLDTFLGLAGGYAAAKVLTTAAKLGLLAPSCGMIAPEAFARACGTSPKGVRLLLNALVGLGIYEKESETYRMTADLRRLFAHHPGLADDLIHHDHLYNVWGRLEEGIRTGRSVPPPEEETRRYPASLATFLKAMRAHAGTLAGDLVSVVPWEGIKRLLDIGGGGGGFALALARRFPQIKITLADLPDAVTLTKGMLAAEPEMDRITFHPCNAYTDPLPPGPFDRIIISHLLHIYPNDDNRVLVAKAAGRLARGGDLLLLDYFLDDTETTPRQAVLFRLLMMIGTPEGDCYRLSQARDWLREAGLTPGTPRSLSRGNTLLAARKL